MSDFIEMRQCLERINEQAKQQKHHLIRKRFVQATACVVLGLVVGLGHGMYQLMKPVGTLSADYCTSKPCPITNVYNTNH